MSERQPLRLKISSDKLACIKSMGDTQKRTRKKRVNWQPGAKLEMLALRDQHPDLTIEEFQKKYYPDRTAKTLGALIRTMRKQSCDEKEEEDEDEDEEAMMASSTVPAMTSSTTPRKRTAVAMTAFEFSDEDVSSSDEQVGDISHTGVWTRNKHVKASHSAEALSSLNTVARRESSIQPLPVIEDPQTTEGGTKQSPESKQSSPVASCMEPITKCAESQPSAICADQSQHETAPPERSEGCVKKNEGDKAQVVTMPIQQQEYPQIDDLQKQEISPESAIRQDFAKRLVSIYSQLQELCQSGDMMFSLLSQTRAQNSNLQKQCDEKDMQLARAQEDAKSWQAEKDTLVNENTRLAKKVELMKGILE